MIIIYGAGMAGLLTANILRRSNPVIHEMQKSLPNNHSALLRFRTDQVSQATNIPFKKVLVRKALKYRGELLTSPSIPACNEYSMKVTGKAMERSAWNLEPVWRYIAPPDFISQAADNLDIRYNKTMTSAALDPCISTIPMPALMDIVGWSDKPEFKFSPIWSYQLDLGENFDIYQTIYYADEYDSIYRASITGSKLIIEFIRDPSSSAKKVQDDYSKLIKDTSEVLKDFGISYDRQCEKDLKYVMKFISADNIKFQKYGKLLPIDEQLRKEFILAMSDEYKIYSIGRFATWRQLLMDDVVNDVKVVNSFITERGSYLRRISA